MIFRQPAKRQVWQLEIILPLCVVIGCYLGGFLALNHSVTSEDYLRVAAIQPSVPQTLIWSPSENARRFQALLGLSQRALNQGTNANGAPGAAPAPSQPSAGALRQETGACDLLVWPESAVPELDDPTYQAINEFVRSNHIFLVLNGDDAEVHPSATNYFNAAFLIGPDGRWRQAYHKRKLVIFGEYVPLANWLPFLKWLTPITGGWTPGDRPATFQLERRTVAPPAGTIQITADPATSGVETVNCAPLICFEDTFPGTVRDSAQGDEDFLLNLTNDGWFGESAEQWQHLANAVFRAVENGLPLLRCANNGITCLIEGHGSIENIFRDARNSAYGCGWLTVEIPLPSAAQKTSPTFYHRHGDWFGWSCVGMTLILLVKRKS
jgi:apolipoprotein N-acyltransferase